MGPMERLALSWGNARQFTKLLLSLLSHIGKMVGCHGFAPCSRRLRAGTSLSKFATQRNAKAELNRRSQACEAHVQKCLIKPCTALDKFLHRCFRRKIHDVNRTVFKLHRPEPENDRRAAEYEIERHMAASYAWFFALS